ncbi:MAG: hypothetical protein ACE5I9_12370, partial [Candidatus Methylomirabilales bacterium]
MHRTIISRLLGYCMLGTLILMAASAISQAESGENLTLEAALHQALQKNPELHVIRQDLAVAQGELTQAQIYPFNPELELEG